MVTDNTEFRKRVDLWLNEAIERHYQTTPSARHLMSSENVNPEYYKRFTVEIILRLRMKRWIDALTIHYFCKHDPASAKKWSNYTEDEMLHDGMFVRDLKRLGMTREEIYDTEPFFATKLLQGYFYYGLEHEGRPLASLSSSYFIEYMSDLTQKSWLKNVGKSLGEDATKGSMAHVDHDEDEDHIDFVWHVLSTFIKTEEDERQVMQHLEAVYRLFVMFFEELHEYVESLGSETNVETLVAAE